MSGYSERPSWVDHHLAKLRRENTERHKRILAGWRKKYGDLGSEAQSLAAVRRLLDEYQALEAARKPRSENDSSFGMIRHSDRDRFEEISNKVTKMLASFRGIDLDKVKRLSGESPNGQSVLDSYQELQSKLVAEGLLDSKDIHRKWWE